MIKNIIVLLILILSFSTCFAETLTATSGDVTFTAVGKPGFLKINGESGGKFPTGSVNFNNGQADAEFEFNLSDLKTGITLRDNHMKEKYLEVAKYPTAKLSVMGLPAKDSQTDSKGDFKGSLTLHGETKEVSGTYTYAGSSKQLTAQFSIKVSDFKIDIPKYLGVTVSESVEVGTKIVLK